MSSNVVRYADWLAWATGAFLVIPVTAVMAIGALDAPFPSPADSENYYSHCVAWAFVVGIVVLSFFNARLWKMSEVRRSILVIRILLALCAAAVAADVVIDVAIFAFVLRRGVSNAAAGPLLVALPLAMISLVASWLIVRRAEAEEVRASRR